LPSHQACAVIHSTPSAPSGPSTTPPVTDPARLRQDSKYQLLTNPHPGVYTAVLVNTTQAPFDNKGVRQALGYALNRPRYYQSVLQGTGSARDLPWPTNSPAYEVDKNARYEFDLNKACSILTQAGVANLPFEITYSASSTALASFRPDLSVGPPKLSDSSPRCVRWNRRRGHRSHQKGQYNGLNIAQGGFGQVQPTTFFLFSIYWQLENNAEDFVSDQYRQLITAASTEPEVAKRSRSIRRSTIFA
jgi:hypothetical protein